MNFTSAFLSMFEVASSLDHCRVSLDGYEVECKADCEKVIIGSRLEAV